jgi:hypothetical protein
MKYYNILIWQLVCIFLFSRFTVGVYNIYKPKHLARMFEQFGNENYQITLVVTDFSFIIIQDKEMSIPKLIDKLLLRNTNEYFLTIRPVSRV